MKSRLVLIYMALMGLSVSVGARELVDLSLDINVNQKGPEAKQEAFDQATEEATRRYTEEILGASRMKEQWGQIRPKLLKNSTRYVLFIKGSTPSETPEGTRMTVQLRVSPDDLEKYLRELGVFAGGTVRVLPLITVSESRGSRYSWWAGATDESGALAQEYFKKVYPQLNSLFKAKSIFVFDPTATSFRMGVPASYRSEVLRREDQALLGQYLKADVILSGSIDVVRTRSDSPEHNVNYSLQLWQARSGRTLADITKTESVANDTPKVVTAVLEQADKKIFTELAGKLAEVAAGGNLNLTTLRISVLGSLNYRQASEFRRQLSELRDIRSLKERLTATSQTVFEAETPVSAGELAKTVQKTRFNGFNVSVDSSRDDSLVLGVRATSAQ